MNRENATLLYFIGGDENTSLQGWRRATSETVKVVKDTLREYTSYESSLDDPESPSLSFIYSLFSVMSILISEEFDAVLVAFIEDNPTQLASFYHEETPLDAVWRKADSIALLVRTGWENAAKYKGVKPVHVLTPYEMKLRLQYQGKLPHTMPPRKRLSVLDFPALGRAVWGNLFLAIDPFTPPEIAGKKVVAMLQDFQAKQAKETEESWEDELKGGIVNREFISRDVEHERLRFDFRRTFVGNKKPGGKPLLKLCYEDWKYTTLIAGVLIPRRLLID